MSGSVNCTESGSRLLPLFESEEDWPQALRAILYALGLGWCFLGVAIVSDIFMGAIEKITSQKTRKKNPITGRYTTHYVWNPTIANLSLMALGSSAPEILLSVIEIFLGDFYAGDLGPSTIVGSAAFNLLMIIAVCVSAIPAGEVRYIKEVPVYMITASCSVFAYVWLIFILLVNSKNVVEPYEGILTFCFFPILLVLAYLADVGYFGGKTEGDGRASITSDMTKEELAEIEARIRKNHDHKLTDDQVHKIIKVEAMNRPTRAHYRVSAIRWLVGGKRVKTEKLHRSNTLSKISGSMMRGASGLFSPKSKTSSKVSPMQEGDTETEVIKKVKQVAMEFSALTHAVLENAGGVKLTVTRSGDTNVAAKVSYKTREGTAKKGSDFVHVEGTVNFASGETAQTFTINIVDDNAYEEDEEFYVDLFDPSIEGRGNDGADQKVEAVLGTNKTVTVVIIDDDLPGIISFPEDTIKVQEGTQEHAVDFLVQRKNGGTGKVTCEYASEDDTARADEDYSSVKGTLTFEPGVMSAKITCKILTKGRYDQVSRFKINLTDPTGGVKFDADTDGGAESCILTVMIQSNQVAKDRIDRIMSSVQQNWSRAKLGTGNWRDKFIQAIHVNGGDDDEDGEGEEPEPPSIMDYVMHFITLPWKLFFALVPPTDYCGGWVCFVSSLFAIGLVTAAIGDLASLLGCALTIQPEITAITFVALGTSMPDTFASKTAATQDPYADASVGNVTGSNSVNVFLGLGLPWMIASMYWTNTDVSGPSAAASEWRSVAAAAGIPAGFRVEAGSANGYGSFIVKAGSLTPAVIIFSCCALTCILILAIRRKVFGGELGGPKLWARVTSVGLMCLWILYVCLASYFAIQAKK